MQWLFYIMVKLTKLTKNNQCKKVLIKLSKQRSDSIVGKILPYLDQNDKILDIGCGFATVARQLQEKNYRLTGVDIKDISLYDDVRPVVYNGKKLPFADNSFDVSLILTVLHHTDNPAAIIREAARVSKRIIIVEDLITTVYQKYLTYSMDCLLNFEFFNHPHTNKTQEEWEMLFRTFGLQVKDKRIDNWFKYFISGTYHLERIRI